MMDSFEKDIIWSAFDGVFNSDTPVEWLDIPTKKDGEIFFELEGPDEKIYRIVMERVN